jgi:predicted acylesterase/phospholipase RssA
MKPPIKTALFLTGAAARISQEVALIDQLISHKGLHIAQNDTLLAGFSSGSLNLAALNAAFANEPMVDWNAHYKQELLFKLTNQQVYKAFPPDHKLFPLLDSSPLRATLNAFLDKMHVKYEGDLPFISYILVFSLRRLTTQWAFNRDAGNKNLVLSDLFMASAAIPVLFPAHSIGNKPSQRRNFPSGKFSDGGSSGTFKKFEKPLDDLIAVNGPLETLYIISPMREKSMTELKSLRDRIRKIVPKQTDIGKIDDFVTTVSQTGFIHFLEKLQNWNTGNAKIKNCFVCIPSMDQNFFILDFTVQREQYDKVCQWIDMHPDRLAVSLDQYLSEHK